MSNEEIISYLKTKVTVIDNGAGGYCGYKCIAYLIFGSNMDYKKLIQMLLAFLEMNKPVYEYFRRLDPHKPPFQKFLSNFRRYLEHPEKNLPPLYWLDCMMTQICSIVFKINIIVIMKRQSSQSPISSILCHPLQETDFSIVLYNLSNEHWFSIMPSNHNECGFPLAESIIRDDQYYEHFFAANVPIVYPDNLSVDNALESLQIFSRYFIYQNSIQGLLPNQASEDQRLVSDQESESNQLSSDDVSDVIHELASDQVPENEEIGSDQVPENEEIASGQALEITSDDEAPSDPNISTASNCGRFDEHYEVTHFRHKCRASNCVQTFRTCDALKKHWQRNRECLFAKMYQQMHKEKSREEMKDRKDTEKQRDGDEKKDQGMINKGMRTSEIPSNVIRDSQDDGKCKGCSRTFRDISKHLSMNSSCPVAIEYQKMNGLRTRYTVQKRKLAEYYDEPNTDITSRSEESDCERYKDYKRLKTVLRKGSGPSDDIHRSGADHDLVEIMHSDTCVGCNRKFKVIKTHLLKHATCPEAIKFRSRQKGIQFDQKKFFKNHAGIPPPNTKELCQKTNEVHKQSKPIPCNPNEFPEYDVESDVEDDRHEEEEFTDVDTMPKVETKSLDLCVGCNRTFHRIRNHLLKHGTCPEALKFREKQAEMHHHEKTRKFENHVENCERDGNHDDLTKFPVYSALKNYVDEFQLTNNLYLCPLVFPEIAQIVQDKSLINQPLLKVDDEFQHQELINEFKKKASSFTMPSFPWYPETKEEEEKVHTILKEWEENLYKIALVSCNVCHQTRIIHKPNNLNTCADCEKKLGKMKEMNVNLHNFCKKYKSNYPQWLPKLTPAEKAIIAYYQPCVTITLKQERRNSLKYRIEQLVVVKEDNPVLPELINLPKNKIDDVVIIERTFEGKSMKQMVVRYEVVKEWLSFLKLNHEEYTNLMNLNRLNIDETASVLAISKERIELQTINSKENNSRKKESKTRSVQSTKTYVEQAELKSDFQSPTYSLNMSGSIYAKPREVSLIGSTLKIMDSSKRVPISNPKHIHFSCAFPELYPYGQTSPLESEDATSMRKNLKGLLHLAYENYDYELGKPKYTWPFAQNPIHTAFCVAHLSKKEAIQSAAFYLSKYPDTSQKDLDKILQRFKAGPKQNEFNFQDVPAIHQHLTSFKNSRENWYSKEKDLECISMDSGDANYFLTFNTYIRYWRDVHNLIHLLEHNMPINDSCYEYSKDYKVMHGKNQQKIACIIQEYVNNNECFASIVSKYAVQIEEYLYFRSQTYHDAWIHSVCKVEKKETNWREREMIHNSYAWRRVEYASSRGIPHWHGIYKLPGVLHLPSLVYIMNRGRQARIELRRKNILIDQIPKALKFIEYGFLAEEYMKRYVDSLVQIAFLRDPMQSFSDENIHTLEEYKKSLGNLIKHSSKDYGINPKTQPLMRRFCFESGKDINEELALIASACGIHDCIQAYCGGSNTGSGCRFNYPQPQRKVTTLGSTKVHNDYMETHVFPARTCQRTANLNKFHLLYWRGNHDGQPLLNLAQSIRYVIKYVSKPAQYTELINAVYQMIQSESNLLSKSTFSTLFKIFTTSNLLRSDLTLHELFYHAMDLPQHISSFSVDVLAYHPRTTVSQIKESILNEHDVTLFDSTLYTAYAERYNNGNKWTCPISIDEICLKDFASYLKYYQWENDQGKRIILKKKGRDAGNKSCHWNFDFSSVKINKHFRYPKFVESLPAIQYKDIRMNYECIESIKDMQKKHKLMLYRAYHEIILYVPWRDNPDYYFLPNEISTIEMNENKNHRAKSKLEAYFAIYEKLHEQDKIGNRFDWHREIVYSHSLYISNKINKAVKSLRAENEGKFVADFVNNNEEDLPGLEEDHQIIEFTSDDRIDFDLPGAVFSNNILDKVLKQSPPQLNEIFTMDKNLEFWKKQSEFFKVGKSLFLADPSPPSVSWDALTDLQKFAVHMALKPVDSEMEDQVLYIIGNAGSGKSEVALHIIQQLKEKKINFQVAASTAKAALSFNAPTFHGAFGLSVNPALQRLGEKSRRLLQDLYKVGKPDECTYFIIDEINNISAILLAKANEFLQEIFNEKGLFWGGRKMIFMGDPAQISPVLSRAFMDYEKVHIDRSVRKSKYKVEEENLVLKGKSLYQKFMKSNVVFLEKSLRSHGLLTTIMNRLRAGNQTESDLEKLTYLCKKFPNHEYHFGIFRSNEPRCFMNYEDILEYSENLNQHVFIAAANYHTENEELLSYLKSVPSHMYNNCADVLLLTSGIAVSLITNINTMLGLTNGSIGTVVGIIYKREDIKYLLTNEHPTPAYVIVDFPDFKGFETENIFKFDIKTWVAVPQIKFEINYIGHRSIQKKFSDITMNQTHRWQFPLDYAKNFTAHKAQGQTWKDKRIYVSLTWNNLRHDPEMSSLLYVACTRSNKLENILLEYIPLKVWLNLGKSDLEKDRRKEESILKCNAKKYASDNGFPRIYNVRENKRDKIIKDKEEEEEWNLIKSITKLPPINYSPSLPHLSNSVHIRNAEHKERIIAIDLGTRNMGICVVSDDPIRHPIVEYIQLIDLHLPRYRYKEKALSELEVYKSLQEHESLLLSLLQCQNHDWMETNEISILLEQYAIQNSWFKLLPQGISNFFKANKPTEINLTIKPSHTKLYGINGPIFKLGFPNNLNINPVEINTRRLDDETNKERKKGQSTQWKVKKSISSEIMKFLMEKGPTSEEVPFNFVIREEVKMYLKTLEKLDDVGDSFLHAMQEVLGQPSGFREIKSRKSVFPSNRCIGVKLTQNHFSFVVFAIANNIYTLSKAETHAIRLPLHIKYKTLDDSKLLEILPPSFKEFLEFTVADNEKIVKTDTIHIIIRQGYSSVTNVLEHKLLRAIELFYCKQNRIKQRKVTTVAGTRITLQMIQDEQVMIEFSAGQQINALQVIPSVTSYLSVKQNQLLTRFQVSLEDSLKLYYLLLNLCRSTKPALNNLILPSGIVSDLVKIKDTKHWIIDLILISLNKSVIPSHM